MRSASILRPQRKSRRERLTSSSVRRRQKHVSFVYQNLEWRTAEAGSWLTMTSRTVVPTESDSALPIFDGDVIESEAMRKRRRGVVNVIVAALFKSEG